MKNFNKSRLGAAIGAGILALGVSQSASSEVSISGWINEGMTYADNGNGSDIVQTSDNGTTLGSRITFAGSTDYQGLNFGFETILEPQSTDGILGFGTTTNAGATGSVNGTFDSGNAHAIGVLGSSVHVGGAFGKVTVGLQSMPTDNIAVLADPSTTLWSSISPIFRGIGVNVGGLGGGAAAGTVYGDLSGCMTAPALAGGLGIGLDCNGIYRQGLRYDLPTFVENLNVAVGYANDDVYDIAAKYNTQLGRVKTMLHVGYAMNNGPAVAGTNATGVMESVDNFQVQLGLMDPNTGLFGTFAYQKEDADLVAGAPANFEDSTDAFWGKIGVKRKFNSLGDTSFAFQYGTYNDQYQTLATANPGMTGSELERIGFEVNQYIGESLILYGVYENLSVDADGTGAFVSNLNSGDDMDTFTMGLTYFF